ncbi:hypothetical protein TCAL_04668 [Tigriopus californicus]|uniref:Rrn7/TAF1B C-terminal cyclin domain-containing protein n=1 Tax=Tigriopus californicus TaxID=6832 RepID=A0A553NTG4_TIGCA|nr:uncharacterized protein LOC131882747 [Tigriopus californicus]TRY68722.1 hypothetical protein TCAL_04668 [Tigriopus californicus]|eukprot:TCALIF_04668-PA protein Name:"Similar to CG6241 TATA box-binding protein-associated factor RNA polymerase I subunit B (Drosophila melanogaster)" AED:0.14 eAED:0.14 QI:526/1/0.66/1/1/0.66/3/0/779
MSQNVAITCEVCDGTTFYKKDGISVCRTCQTESQEHGQDTVADAETMGIFGAGAGPLQLQKVLVRSKKAKKAKTQKLIKSPTSFTTTDLSSFVLKGWVDELIALGADPSLKEITLTLWSLRLQLSGQGFGKDMKSKFNSVRDLQVKLFNRKRMVIGSERKYFKRKRTQHVPIVSSDEEENQFDAREQRKKRARKRRKFLKNLVDESFSENSGNSTISSNTSWLSNYDQGFDTSDVEKTPESQRPTSSNASQSNNESDWENLSMNASSVNPSSTTEEPVSDKSENEDHDETRETQSMIIDRSTRHYRHIGERSPFSKPQMMTTLLLALALTENNQWTVADILFWIRTGAISYYHPWPLIPKCMKAYVRIDTALSDAFEITHDISGEVRYLGCFFELGEVELNRYEILQNTLRRYLEDLCLPKELFDVITASLTPNTGLLELKVLLGGSNLNKVEDTTASCERRVLALILFCLKYLYVLDDSTELVYSDYARTWNQSHRPESSNEMFDIGAWLAMSKVRLQLACKYAFPLRTQYEHLFPEVEMSLGTLMQKYEFQESNSKEGLVFGKRSRYLNFIATLPLFKRHASIPTPFNRLDLVTSLRPLSDFSAYFLSDLPSGHETISTYAKSALRKLKLIGESHIHWPEVEPSATDVDIKFHWKKFSERVIRFKNINHGHLYNSQLLSSRRQRFNQHEGLVYPRFNYYWFLNYGLRSNRPKVRGSTNKAMADMHILQLPDNFQWIASYLAAYIHCSTIGLLNELRFVENQIRLVSPLYFGAHPVSD